VVGVSFILIDQVGSDEGGVLLLCAITPEALLLFLLEVEEVIAENR